MLISTYSILWENVYVLASTKDCRRWANSVLKDTWVKESASHLCGKIWMHKYMSITFLVLLTAAAKNVLLKISLSCYISGGIFPELSQSSAVFSWLPLHFFIFHVCSEHKSRLSLRAFLYTQHPHILKIHIATTFWPIFSTCDMQQLESKYKALSASRATKILDCI